MQVCACVSVCLCVYVCASALCLVEWPSQAYGALLYASCLFSLSCCTRYNRMEKVSGKRRGMLDYRHILQAA